MTALLWRPTVVSRRGTARCGRPLRSFGLKYTGDGETLEDLLPLRQDVVQRLVHCAIGKASFEDEQLLANLATLMDEIVKAKPGDAKGQYIRSATLTSTMGPGIPLEVAPVLALAAES